MMKPGYLLLHVDAGERGMMRTICTECIMAKRCVLEQKLLLTA